jgi:multiple sugar transport system permease protein
MTDTARPPTGKGPLARREARLAWQMLLPTILSVSLVVVLPLLAVFWISVKPVTLADLRPPTPLVSERLRSRGDADFVEYRLRNSSQSDEIRAVVLTDTIPEGVVAATPPDPCIVDGRQLTCDFGTLEPGFRTRLQLPVTLPADAEAAERAIEDETPVTAIGRADNILTSGEFTLQNFARIFDGASSGRCCGRPCSTPSSAPSARWCGAFRGAVAQQVVSRARASCAGCTCFPMSRR